MKTIEKTKKTIETSLEANLTKEPMSALFFCSWLKLIVNQNLKHKQKAYLIFFK